MAKHNQDTTAGNSITVDEKGIIIVVARGKEPRHVVAEAGEKIAELCKQTKEQYGRVLLLLDLSHQSLSSATGGGRSEVRRLAASLNVDAYAVVGNSKLLTLTTYLARSARPHARIGYFTSTPRAKTWLLTMKTKGAPHSFMGLIYGCIIISIGALALLGWAISNPFLMGFLPHLRPINPMAAVATMLMSFGFIFYWQNTFVRMRVGSVIMILLGLTALLPLSIDTWLFADKVNNFARPPLFADSAAICFILMGVIGLIAGRTAKWVRPLELGIAGFIGATALFNAFGLLYAPKFMYSLGDSYVMAFNLSIAFLVAAVGLAFLVIYRRAGNITHRVSMIGWLMVIAIIIVQAATYAAWSQTVDRNQKEAQQSFTVTNHATSDRINSRLQAYSDALRGFAGFYQASDEVTHADFETYNDSLQLAAKYPGLRSFAFIAAVDEKDLPAFIAERRRDTSLRSKTDQNFTIKSKTNEPVHYIVTYIADNPESANTGLDLTSVPGRTQTYGNAIAAGDIYGSGSVEFRGLQTKAQRGFFITIPVKNAGSDTFTGVVNANFSYVEFFDAVFAKTDLLKDIAIRIIDNEDKSVLYEKNNLSGERTFENASTINIAGRVWTVQTATDASYSLSTSQLRTPASTIAVGQIFSILLLFIFLSQIRARQQALELVDMATKDLQHERDIVTTLHQKDEAILSSIGEGLVAVDRHGKVELANKAALQSFGLDESQLLNHNLTNIIHAFKENGEIMTPDKRPIMQTLKNGKVTTTVILYGRKNGDSFPARLTVAPILSKGKVIGAIEVFRDITQEYALDKAKGEFVSLASHQLRTPLSAINWYAEMLLNGDAGKITDDQTTYLKEIYEGNQRMIELVNALLDVSRLDLGRMVNQAVPTNFVEIVESIEHELQTSIVSKGLTMHRDLDHTLPLINGDPKLLRIIAQNLMSNAVKYTPDKGNVYVALRSATAAEVLATKLPHHGDYIHFSVKDTGYGIPETQRVHIFEKLFRADNVRRLDVEGTGLGLYLVKQVVEGMGGKVWFDSQESIGTTFYVILPIKTRGIKKLSQ